MRIEAYLVMWNELDMVKLVVSHYQRFCDRIVILDNHSTDGSDKLAESLGCEVVKFGTKFFDDAENMAIKNSCWKNSTADWVIVADFDEILCAGLMLIKDRKLEWEPNPKGQIEWFADKGYTIYKTVGWQIISNQMPDQELTEVTNGFRFDNYSKNIIFNPKEITAINYNPGAHRCEPEGNVVWSEEELYVLHYKHVGGVDRTIKRYAEYKPRMSKNNRKLGWGSHYQRTPGSLREEWNERMAKSKNLI